jgi:L-asparaginase II
MSMSDPLVVEVERSGLVESTHLVDVAVAASDGTRVASAGDPETVAYLRSSAKPIQAAVCLDARWQPPSEEQLAVACASHNGEPAHLAAVRVTLAAAGLDEDALRCPASWPLSPEVAAGVSEPSRILHNCSGKHAAMLATCVVNGWPLDDYRALTHPLQRAISQRVEALAGRPSRAVGVDGCGVPTFALTLAEAARAFAALAAGGTDTGVEALEAMSAHPFLVAGTGRLCTAVLKALPGIVVKAGAEGIFCGVLGMGGTGIALKSRDGTGRARDAAAVATLRLLNAWDVMPESLAPFLDAPVTGGGEPVGSVRVRGDVQPA